MNKYTNNDPNQNKINENLTYHPNLVNQKVFPQEKRSDYAQAQNSAPAESYYDSKETYPASKSDRLDEAFRQGLADGAKDRYVAPLPESDNSAQLTENTDAPKASETFNPGFSESQSATRPAQNPREFNTPNRTAPHTTAPDTAYNNLNAGDLNRNVSNNVVMQNIEPSAHPQRTKLNPDSPFAPVNKNNNAYGQVNPPVHTNQLNNNYNRGFDRAPLNSHPAQQAYSNPYQTFNPNINTNPNPNTNPVSVQPSQNGYTYPQNNYALTGTSVESEPEKPKKSNKKLIILIIVIVAVFALLVTAFCFAVAYFTSDSSNNTVITSDREPVTSKPVSSDVWGIDSEDITDPNNSGLNINDQPEINVNEYSAQAAYETLSKSVVGIQCFEKGLQEVNDGPAGEGTGIIVDKDGYIVTNSHVIGDSKTLYDVYVSLSDDEQYEARIVGFDAKTDLAVLKIKPDGELTPATFADSEQISVGQDVIALGNPGGSEYSNSLTKGIISAVNRSVSTYSYVNYIQTDAAINPGNSGGPLANLYGQVIGINTIKIVDEEYEGMGFAIPSNTVKKICDDLITLGYVSNRVRIGITGQEISTAMASSYNMPSGILIVGFSSDSPFKETDAKENDIITAFDGEEIHSFSELYKQLDKHSPGDEVTVTLYRQDSNQNGKTFDVRIKLLADLGETQVTE